MPYVELSKRYKKELLNYKDARGIGALASLHGKLVSTFILLIILLIKNKVITTEDANFIIGIDE